MMMMMMMKVHQNASRF